MIERGGELSVRRQAELLDVSRASVYYRPRAVSARDLQLMRRIDELHLEAPFYGARKITAQLQREGHEVGRRHVRTLMRQMGIEALYRKPRTSIPARGATIYPYLLDNLVIDRSNQVWSSDLTYFADGARVYVPGGDFGCGEPQSIGLAAVEHAERALLCRSARGGDEKTRAAEDFQYRPRIAIHQRGLDRAAESRRRCDQHGWQGSLDRQRFYRATVAERQVRGGVSAGVCERD